MDQRLLSAERLIALVLLASGTTLARQVPCSAESREAVTAARIRLDQQFDEAIDRLASEGDTDEQRRVRREARIGRDPSRQYFFVPAELRLDNDSRNTTAADAELERIEGVYADQLFRLVKRAINERRGALAYQWSHEILRYRPDHSGARRILGLPAEPPTSWPITVRPGRRRHPKLGWAAGTHRQVDTPHFRITTDDSEQAARALAEILETLHATWRQLFFDLWSNPNVLRVRMNGRTSLNRRQAKHQVILFRSREAYIAYLEQLEPQAQLTLGYYHAPSRTALFYGSEDDHRSTWQHEATHQLFQEILGAPFDVGNAQHFWVLEGIALYMESLQPIRDYISVGGLEADRLQFARYRALREGFYEPLERLTSMGRRSLQQDPRIRQLYSQAAGLTHFLMDDERGRYRQALTQYLRAVYENRAERDVLVRLTKSEYSDLDARYREFLQVNDETLKQMDHSVVVRNLALGHTQVGDEGLMALPDLTHLVWLDLKGTHISDAGTQRFTDARRLRQLNLEETIIGDDTVERLAEAGQIEELDLSNTKITDRSLTTIKKMPQLKSLWLTGTDVTDSGLEHLRGLSQLETLDVSKTRVTKEGWQTIRAVLPQLK